LLQSSVNLSMAMMPLGLQLLFSLVADLGL